MNNSLRSPRTACNVAAMCMLLYALILTNVIGCGDANKDKRENPETDDSNAASSSETATDTFPGSDTTSGTVNEDTTSEQTVYQEPYAASPEGECEAPHHLFCRGICFTEAGQKENGCEVLHIQNNTQQFIHKAYMDETIIAIAVDEDMYSEYGKDLIWLDPITKTKVSTDRSAAPVVDAMVVDGVLYDYGPLRDWIDQGLHGEVVRALQPDGSFEPTSRLMGSATEGFCVFDGYVYVSGHTTTDEEDYFAVYRYPLTVGADYSSPVWFGDNEEAELIVRDVIAYTFAFDGEYMYFGSSHIDQGIDRVRIGEPDSHETLNAEFRGRWLEGIALPEGDPEYVYFAPDFLPDYLYRVPRAGGPAERVLAFPEHSELIWTGQNEMMIWTPDTGLYVVNYATKELSLLLEDIEKPVTAVSMSLGDVVVLEWGVLLIDRATDSR
ncbi:MAG: hypothetical protein JXX14_03175 [Deltaproteobacteria bacterium]|nr:hypothetical protein [Deltaproteobacteria bacterium]